MMFTAAGIGEYENPIFESRMDVKLGKMDCFYKLLLKEIMELKRKGERRISIVATYRDRWGCAEIAGDYYYARIGGDKPMEFIMNYFAERGYRTKKGAGYLCLKW